jgi:hypothetical protein
MNLEMVLSTAMLGSFIWSITFLLPKAFKQHDGLAITAAVITATFALLLWLLIGVRTRS